MLCMRLPLLIIHVVADIRIHFALREPQTKLFRSSDANKLLIVTYAADGNSYPGTTSLCITDAFRVPKIR